MQNRDLRNLFTDPINIGPYHPLVKALNISKEETDPLVKEVLAQPTNGRVGEDPHVKIREILQRHFSDLGAFHFSYLEMIPIGKIAQNMFPLYDNGNLTYFGTSNFTNDIARLMLTSWVTSLPQETNTGVLISPNKLFQILYNHRMDSEQKDQEELNEGDRMALRSYLPLVLGDILNNCEILKGVGLEIEGREDKESVVQRIGFKDFYHLERVIKSFSIGGNSIKENLSSLLRI